MKKLLILILCCVVGGVNAQSYCEVDSVYKNYDRETGCRVIQTSDGNFVVLSIAGQSGPMVGAKPKFMLTKIDICGNVLWRSNPYDSSIGGSGVSDLFEDHNGNIIFSGFFKEKKGKDIRLFKTDPIGNFLWSVRIGLSEKEFQSIKGLKVTNNKYLFFGSYYRPNITFGAIAIMADTLGNIIFEDTSTMSGLYISANILSPNNILLTGVEDTSILILNIDTIGNIYKKSIFPKLRNMTISFIGVTEDLNKLFYFAKNSSNQTLIAHLDFNGKLIKDSLYESSISVVLANTSNFCPYSLNNNCFILPGEEITIIDSNLHIAWEDKYETISNRRQAYYSIFSKDSSVVSVGSGNFRSMPMGNLISDFWFGIKTTGKLIKAITINGADKIDANHGSLQLSVLILPHEALNKNVFWELNDSSIASINQTGLLTAKANGIVTVTAKTTDGSNLAASKQITITNQGVGLLKNDLLDSQIEIFPNPASTHLSVLSKDLKIQLVQLIDIQGKTLNTFTNPEQIYLNSFTNGYFFLKIETDKGTVFKKLVINK